MDLSLLSVVYCQVKVSAMGRSLVYRCCVSQCDREASTMKTSWPPVWAVKPRGKKISDVCQSLVSVLLILRLVFFEGTLLLL